MLLTGLLEFADLAAVQRPHEANAGEHSWSAQVDNQHQRFNRRLPFGQRGFVFS